MDEDISIQITRKSRVSETVFYICHKLEDTQYKLNTLKVPLRLSNDA